MIKLLDENFNLIDTAKVINLQWNRKYYDYGSYSMVIQRDNIDGVKYVARTDSNELGLINKYSISNNQVTIEGYFYERKLNDYVTYPSFEGMGTLSSVCQKLYEKYAQGLFDNVVIEEEGVSIKTTSYGDELGTKLQELLKNQQMAFKGVYDGVSNNLHFYKGRFKTCSSGDKNAIIFDDKINIHNVSFDLDDSNHKTLAIVKAKFNGFDIDEQVQGNGYDIYGRKELYVDARDLSAESDNEEEFRQLLRERGEEKLLEHKLVTNVLFDIDPSNYEYRKDYDLGDICEVWIRGVLYELPIIATYEVFKSNGYSIQIEMGESIPTQLEQVENNQSTVIDNYENLDGLPTINGEIVTGNIDVITEEQTKALLGGMGGYLKILYNEDNQPSGFLIKDALEDSEAKNVILWNNAGIGFSTNGINGPYNNAWTIDGKLSADFLYTGQISDKKGNNFWNLETGELQIASTADFGGESVQEYKDGVQKDITNVNNNIGTQINDYDDTLTQQYIFNRLTNNGQTQGVYLKNGKLYINADYIGAGNIGADRIDVNSLSAISANLGTITGGSLNINNKFKVDSSGNLTATNANLTGSFHTTSSNYSLDIDDSNYRVYDSSGKQIMGLGLYVGGSIGNTVMLDGKNGWGSGLAVGAECVFRAYENIYGFGQIDAFTSIDMNRHTIDNQSDIRKKKDITKLNDFHEKLFNCLNPSMFKYIEDDKKYNIGYIANDIENFLNQNNLDINGYSFIKKDDKGFLSLAYSEFIALNTHMIKKCMKRIEKLENEIKNLKGETQ